LKQRIIYNLIAKGYDKTDILNILNKKKIDTSSIYLEQEIKIRTRLSIKYKDAKLEYEIKQALYKKGF
jgi:SOS response regulatory protein OraA/RecX